MFVYIRVFNIGKESYGKMVAIMYVFVLMLRWVNINVYLSKYSLDFFFFVYLGSCFEYFFF